MIIIPQWGYVNFNSAYYTAVQDAGTGAGAVGINFESHSDLLDTKGAMDALVSNGFSAALLTFVRPIVQLVTSIIGAGLMAS